MDTPVALVTGSSRRLGRKIAMALAEEGYDLVIHYRSSRREALATQLAIRKIGRKALIVKADLTKSSDVKKLFKRTMAAFKKIDVLVNNAAVFPPRSEVGKIPEKLWDTIMDHNLKSVFLCCEEAAKVMLKRKEGKIINIASLGAFLAWKNFLPYNVSKAGVVTLTKVLAKALAPSIQVNAIAPGTIIIPNEEVLTEHFPSVDKIPLSKYGKPSDISDMVVFLATKSEYMTGQVIRIDGGVTI